MAATIRNHDTTAAALHTFTLSCRIGKKVHTVKTVQYSLYWAAKHAQDQYPGAVIMQKDCKPYKQRVRK